VYFVAGLVVLHFFWMRAGKQDFAEVLAYGSLLGTLLVWRAWRLGRWLRTNQMAGAEVGQAGAQRPQALDKRSSQTSG